MVTIEEKLRVEAPIENVWDILWKSEKPEWLQPFYPNAEIKSDWTVDGRTYFGSEDGNGLVGTISELDAPRHVIFKVLGYYRNGEEITQTKEVMEWSGNQVKFILDDFEGFSTLQIKANVMPYQAEPLGILAKDVLLKVKELAERSF